jgi:hypothetical protein
MNLAEAEKLVLLELAKTIVDVECELIHSKTIEKDWGWVFFYQSSDFIKSGDFLSMLGGNAPIIVNKLTGDLTYTGTALEVGHYIKEYESSL